MRDAIVRAARPPEITMSVDSTAYFGQNQIRRNVAKTTSLYVGRVVSDRVITIPPNSFIEIQLSFRVEGDVFDPETKSDVFFTEDSSCGIGVPVSVDTTGCAPCAPCSSEPTAPVDPINCDTKALYLDTNQPLVVHINGTLELNMRKHMFLDHPVNTLGLENLTCHEARVIVAYIA